MFYADLRQSSWQS